MAQSYLTNLLNSHLSNQFTKQVIPTEPIQSQPPIKPEGSPLCSQKPIIGSYPGPDKSNSNPCILSL
jgi:hypothetical protein